MQQLYKHKDVPTWTFNMKHQRLEDKRGKKRSGKCPQPTHGQMCHAHVKQMDQKRNFNNDDAT